MDLFSDNYDMEQSPKLCAVATCTEVRTELRKAGATGKNCICIYNLNLMPSKLHSISVQWRIAEFFFVIIIFVLFFIEFCEAEKAGIVFVKMEKDEEKIDF